MRALKHGSKAAASPGRCETLAGTPAGTTLSSQELGAVAAAGQSTRTGVTGLDTVLNAAIDSTLKARLVAAISLQLSVQVNAAFTAGFDAAQLCAILSAKWSVESANGGKISTGHGVS